MPLFCLKALHRLGAPVTMSELGKQLHCDRSFVTMIADTLEARGLARREPNPTDRRLKNLVLTPQGMELKERLEAALLAEMPWAHALDMTERAALLELIRKMTRATAAAPLPGRSRRHGGGGGTGNFSFAGRDLSRETSQRAGAPGPGAGSGRQ